jgi:hypothetical protein
MNDTTKEIYRKQFEIIKTQSLEQRIKGIFEMTELSSEIIKNRIKEAHPHLTETELKVETFKIFYRLDFDSITLNQIASSMSNYLEKNSDVAQR